MYQERVAAALIFISWLKAKHTSTQVCVRLRCPKPTGMASRAYMRRNTLETTMQIMRKRILWRIWLWSPTFCSIDTFNHYRSHCWCRLSVLLQLKTSGLLIGYQSCSPLIQRLLLELKKCFGYGETSLKTKKRSRCQLKHLRLLLYYKPPYHHILELNTVLPLLH